MPIERTPNDKNGGTLAHPKKDFCRKVGIGPTTFHKLINTGKLKAVKIGSKTFVTDDEARRFLASLPAA